MLIFVIRARRKFDELTSLQLWRDLEPDLAARLIRTWYEAISWRTPFITFIVRVKNTEQLAIRRSYNQEVFDVIESFLKERILFRGPESAQR